MSDSPDESRALDGLVVHLTAHRRAEETTAALARHGARVVHCPAMVPVPPSTDQELVEATDRVIAARPEIVVVTTGVGLRGWLEAAESSGRREALIRTLAGARILARGSKAHGAVRAAGLKASWVSAEETAADVMDHLRGEDLTGASVALQYHGMGTDSLDEFVRAMGGTPLGVVVYRYTVPEDTEPVLSSVADAAEGRADAVLFTAAGGAREWLRPATAEQRRALADRSAAGELGLFAVGPVTAAPLEEAGLAVLQPERHRLGSLLRLVTAWGTKLTGSSGQPHETDGARR